MIEQGISAIFERNAFYGSSQYLLSPVPVSPFSHRSICYTPMGDIATTRGRYCVQW
jgi:hypothetical protein